MNDYVPERIIDMAFRRLGRGEMFDRLHAVRALCGVRGMRYVDARGRARTIDVALKPWVLTSSQILAFHRVAQLLAGSLLKLPRLYAALPELRDIISFSPEKESWLALASHPRARPMAVIGRLDSSASYANATWKAAFRMLEPNCVGVGGLHYAPIACGVLMDVVGDILTRALPGRAITATPDPRLLLIDELMRLARCLGRPLRGVALIENTDYTTGTDEFQGLAGYLTGRGIKAVVADPRELSIRKGRMTARGIPVDLLYRDSELQEFVEMEAKGNRLSCVRHAVKEGRLISGLAWEFDQKSAWEVFTDPRYTKHFSPKERLFFRRHIPWTRMVRDTRVSSPSGRMVDLPAFIRKNRARLVLKPNDLFGGEDVMIGSSISQRDWERRLQRALHGNQRYVAQQVVRINSEMLPLLENGRPRWRRRSTVSGFFFSSSGIGLIGRYSRQKVVNVTQGGGIVSALWVH